MIRLYAHGVVSSLANGRIIQMFRAVASGSALPWRRQLARLRSHPRMALPQLSRVSHGDKLASIPRPISWIRLRCSCGSDASPLQPLYGLSSLYRSSGESWIWTKRGEKWERERFQKKWFFFFFFFFFFWEQNNRTDILSIALLTTGKWWINK